ncbi:hypothetical protein B9Z65_8906 [Elsinoe australis]|uniref:Uncharacterized protein n=1 Tax=Elsinoe australis TaxID=40998 RepID=A0A2P7YF40_9PEZI|nr:hypothetical protein B9Z65_8906 [Elsinoe australis]
MNDGDLDLDLDVDADDYAEAAAEDIPSTNDRTHLSDEAFNAIKATYVAKHDNGSIYKSLLTALPDPGLTTEGPSGDGKPTKPALSNKHIQLVSAAAGELYYFKNYEQLIDLIAWLRERYDIDGSGTGKGNRRGKFGDTLQRWEGRCRARIAEGGGEG